jgi:hypothetical protein
MRFFILIIAMLVCTIVHAQTTDNVSVNITLQSVALLDIEPNNTSITLAMTSPTEAGNAINSTTNNSKWLNFTSAVTPALTRRVTAQLTGTLPSGVNLRLSIAPYSGSGAGTLGTPVTAITLNNTAQTIINNIGGAYTGNGTNNGYNLTYSLQISNYSQLRQQTSSVSIIYTLADN